MTPELEVLARRAVACKGWRWLPGMRWTNPPKPGGYGPLDGAGRLGETEATYLWPPDGAVPDLGDPATLGCLLALVRKAWGSNRCFVRRDPSWFMLCPTPPAEAARIGHGWSGPFTGDTEAEALLAALEAAP